MEALKKAIKTRINSNNIIFKVIRKFYHVLSSFKYKVINYKKISQDNKKLRLQINKAIDRITEYSQKDYIVFYNPNWLGVANSTKGLFKNIVPLEQVYKKKDAERIADAINQSDIKNVIFSQIVDGWTEVIEKIKVINPIINVKVIWHGNCYEFFSDYTWNLNQDVIKLYNEKKIQAFGFVRSTMKEFYEKLGIKSFYLQNNVNIHTENPFEVFDNINNKNNNTKEEKVKIGIYNSDSRELKNLYTSLASVKLVPNAIADVVPINKGAKEYCEIIGLDVSSIDNYIPTDELLNRIRENTINLYPTYTENSPMFPLESFEMGVPCLVGNNNDFFSGYPLEEYVVVKREDDIEYIKNKIEICINNREKILYLYREWKKDFDFKCNELVNDFLSN